MTALAGDDRHVLVTTPYVSKIDLPVDREWLTLSCGRFGCVWSEVHIVSEHRNAQQEFDRAHGCLNDGKAPNIEPEWNFVTTCPVCPGYVGLETDGESIWCKTCSATWGMSGTGGEIEER